MFMRRSLLFILLLSISTVFSFSQVTEPEETLKKEKTDIPEGWKRGALVSISMSQVSLTNWASGGQNSISGNGILNMNADFRHGTFTWNNNLDLAYGLQKLGKAGMIKTDDKVDFSTKVGRRVYHDWFLAGLMNFRTQMTAGYNYPNDSVKISNFLAPAYVLTAIGLDYKKGSDISLFVAPLTGKVTIVNDQTLADAGAFGVDKAVYDSIGNLVKHGKKLRQEFGGYIKATYKKDLFSNISFQSKLGLFSNFIKNPQNIDVNWENFILIKVSKWITVSVTTQLLYDDDTDILVDEVTGEKGPRTQFKQVLGLGFSYKF
jgi:hypothetical protein